MKVSLARDLNLAFSVIQRVDLSANSQLATIPIRNFVLLTTPRPPALTHISRLAHLDRPPPFEHSFSSGIHLT